MRASTKLFGLNTTRLDQVAGHAGEGRKPLERRPWRRSRPTACPSGGARILPTFAESLSRKATRGLIKLGVEVSTGVKVEKVDDQGVIAAGVRIPSGTVLWTAGVSASPAVKMLGTKTGRAGRAFVGAFMDIPEAPNVFVGGDAATMTQDGHPVPGVAQAPFNREDLPGVSSPIVSEDERMVDPFGTETKATWRWSARTSPSSRLAICAAAAL